MTVRIETRKVYHSTHAGRSYLTRKAAIAAEAAAIIKQKYPTERPWHDEIGMVDPGFHWRSLHRSDVLFRRLCRLVQRSIA